MCGTPAGAEKIDPRKEGFLPAQIPFGGTKEGSVGGDRPEVQFDVKFLLKQVGAALGIAEIFGDIAARFDFQGHGATLEGSAHVLYTLAM